MDLFSIAGAAIGAVRGVDWMTKAASRFVWWLARSSGTPRRSRRAPAAAESSLMSRASSRPPGVIDEHEVEYVPDAFRLPRGESRPQPLSKMTTELDDVGADGTGLVPRNCVEACLALTETREASTPGRLNAVSR